MALGHSRRGRRIQDAELPGPSEDRGVIGNPVSHAEQLKERPEEALCPVQAKMQDRAHRQGCLDRAEAKIGWKILNTMTDLGMPQSYRVR